MEIETKIIVAIISAFVAVIGAILSFYSANKNFKLNRNNQAINYLNGKVDKLEKAIENLNSNDVNKVDKKDFVKEGAIYLEKYFDNAVETYEKYCSYLSNYENGEKLDKEIEHTKFSISTHRIENEINPKNKNSKILTGDEVINNYVKIPKEINKIFNIELILTIEHLEKIIGYTK